MGEDTLDMSKRVWNAAWINTLPDEAFAVILSGGEKDEDGLTKPRSLRKLPHHNSSVKDAADNDSVDLPHLRNALAREPQTDMSAADHKKARGHLERHAKALLKTDKAFHKDVSYGDICRELGKFLEDEVDVDENSQWPYPVPKYWIWEVFGDYVVLRSNKEEKLFKLPYTVVNGEIVFNWEELSEVVIEFTPKQFHSFRSYKGADGKWHWATMTGSSFVDKEDEIISNKSLDSGVARGDETGERGPLRLYHVKGADVGACRAQVRIGNFLVEAGDWDETPLAVAARTWVETHPDEAGVSIGFRFNPADRVDGVYTGPIEIIERSLLNVRDAACPWTKLWDAQEQEKMGTKEQVAEIVGTELAEEVFSKAEKQTEELKAEGVAFKATPEEPVVAALEPEAKKEESPPQPVKSEPEAKATTPDPLLVELRGILATMAEQAQTNTDKIGKLEAAVSALSAAQKEWVSNAPRAAHLDASARAKAEDLPAAKVDAPDAESKAKSGAAGKSGLFDVPLADSIQEILRARQQ